MTGSALCYRTELELLTLALPLLAFIHEGRRETVWKIAEGVSTLRIWRQEAADSSLLRPPLAALGAPIRCPIRFSKQFLEEEFCEVRLEGFSKVVRSNSRKRRAGDTTYPRSAE